MQELVHHNVQKISILLTRFNSLMNLYQARSYDFDATMESYFNEVILYFKSKGDCSQESEMTKLHSRIITVKRGFNPILLEKINVGKREFILGFSFNALEDVQKILKERFEKEERKLSEGEELLSSLIISLFQSNMIDNQQLKNLNSIPAIEIFWTNLILSNPSIMSINQKLRLTLIAEDIYLLLEKIIVKLN